MTASDILLIDRHEAHVVVTLNNPPMNVVSAPLTRALYATLRQLERDDAVRALVLTGAGNRAFCAGSDITEITNLLEPGAVLEHKLIFQNKVFELLRNFPKPTIAALNGYTYGGGLEVALCCDLLVAEEQVLLAQPEIKLGVFPSSGGTYRLAKRIGEGRARQMVFFGEPITAAQALDWGLVQKVVSQGSCLEEANALAARLARGPSQALLAAKDLIGAAFDCSDAELVARSLIHSDRVFCAEDAKEGVEAFLAKRPASFN